MKSDNFPSSSVMMAILLLGAFNFAYAGDEEENSLEAFRQKVVAKENERSGEYRGQGGVSSLATQIQLLQGLIAREEFYKSRQIITNMSDFSIPPDLQDEWLRTLDLLKKKLQAKEAEAMKKWRAAVDQLLKDVKNGCVNAKASSDLEPLFERCASIQLYHEQQQDVLAQRTSDKLRGIVDTLKSWTDYLDYRDSGNIEQANEALERLKSGGSEFPILSVKEIDSQVQIKDLRDPGNSKADAIIRRINSCDEIPAALELLNNHPWDIDNPNYGYMRQRKEGLENAYEGWKAAKAGDYAAAEAAIVRSEKRTHIESELREEIYRQLFQLKAKSWTKLTQYPSESIHAFMGRILDELFAKDDYKTMIEVMDSTARNFGQFATGSSVSTSQATMVLQQFLAAKRFESVGDSMAAITNYRNVIASSEKYAPVAKAEEAMKNLKAKDPDAFKSYESAVMEDLRGIRDQMKLFLARPVNPPNANGQRPPGYP